MVRNRRCGEPGQVVSDKPGWRPPGRPGTIGSTTGRRSASGPNRFELIPIAGESGERMMAVWFPERRLLYGSDLAQRSPQGEYFMPAYLLELIDLCRREELAQARLFAMHLDATPWSAR